ncbi:MAG TPA: FtsW/RodA/SpoVE family cell cycle protein [Magnetospirillaceae bacterium]|nr:FtsW/RodA/SpoVE family cell cycle protein [Magnetospirillaceae bacterium]
MLSGFAIERTFSGPRGDPSLLAAPAILFGTGLAVLYSASYGFALSLERPAEYFLFRHLGYAPLALVLFLACAFVPVDRLKSIVKPLTLLALAAIILPFIPGIGVTRNGASRWIAIGARTFQPSQVFRVALVLYLAHIFSKKGGRMEDVVNSVLPPLFITGTGALIILLQNDFSTAVILVLIAAALFWAAEVPLRFFAALSTILAPLIALSVLISDSRLRRVIGFLYPGYDPMALSYQVLASLRAIRAGGLWGRGLGLGTLKLASVPEVQSDFVFSAFAEEAGLLGVLGFLGLWGFFLARAYRTALRNQDRFRSYLAFGLATSLAVQVLVNVSVTAGVLPATGISLPFFSAGGSSLLETAASCGLLYNLSRNSSDSPRDPEEADYG